MRGKPQRTKCVSGIYTTVPNKPPRRRAFKHRNPDVGGEAECVSWDTLRSPNDNGAHLSNYLPRHPRED